MGITAGANAWRKVEGMVGDRRISRKRKGNVLSSCVTPALTEKQQKVQICKIQPGKNK